MFHGPFDLSRVLKYFFETFAGITWSVHILFCVVVYDASVMFDTITKQIERIFNEKSPSIASQLETWRQNHVLVCQLVDNINECFGIILLISIGSYFISSVTVPYEIYLYASEYLNGRGPPMGLVLRFVLMQIRDISHFILLILTPYKMRGKVSISVKMIIQLL